MCAIAACAFGGILVKDGDTLAFLGDSITDFGPTVSPMRSGSTFHVLEDVAQ